MLDLLLLLMVVIWGSNFSVVKYALRDFPEIPFNALRLMLASAVFLVAIAVVRHRAKAGLRPPEAPLTRQEWRRVVFLGLVGTVLYQLLFLGGVARTSVANAALIFGCTPVSVAILASIAGHDRLTAPRWAGAALSLAGIYAIVGHGASLSTATLTGDALMFGGMLCWSIYSVGAQPLLQRHSPLVVTGWAMITGAMMYLVVAAVPMMRTNWSAISATSWFLMAASSLLALSFSYMVWYTAVQKIGSARTAIYSNLTPIVAMIVAALWLGEQITRVQVFGTALVLGGLAVTRWRAIS
ncbi:MAG: DMT family transporter [Acidobacteria bacterium]|nr:DMT family transporter [Acidobacteriota bacterium]